MSELAAAQEQLSRCRASFEMRPESRDAELAVLNGEVRMLRIENRELKQRNTDLERVLRGGRTRRAAC